MRFSTVTPDMFGAISFGLPGQNSLNYIQEQMQRIDPSRFLNNNFIQEAKNMVNKFSGSQFIEKVKNITHMNRIQIDPLSVYAINSLTGMQTADIGMQRWIMANPNIRDLYNHNRCAGYGESYIDKYPGTIGPEHYDYRRVMDGMLEEVEPDEDGSAFKFTLYMDSIQGPNDDLDFHDKVDILSTWDVLNHILKDSDDDPTDPYGGKL